MKLSRNWLLDYVEISDISVVELAERFTMSTAEIEGVEVVGNAWPGVVTAKILSIEPHPDAEKLRLPTVTTGTEEIKLVCGAPNIEVGQIIPLATLGAELPGGFVIKKAKIRGVTSTGMLCSKKELGLSEESDGIMILAPDTPLGVPLAQVMKLEDTIFVLDNKSVTHRPDLWGHYGIARELSAIFERPLLPLNPPMVEEGAKVISIRNEAPEVCPYYSALRVSNIKVGPSPEWIQRRLEAIGSRAINNVVDATNYVLYELGQPLHSFDANKIKGDGIGIRLAKQGEVLETLDGDSLTLTSDDLVISDSERPVALAGVMGGANTEVDDNTTAVLLESATFHPATIRRTSVRYAKRSDSSMRFEKSLDPNLRKLAILRFCQLLRETCPDLVIDSKIADFSAHPVQTIVIPVSPAFINKRLGTELSAEAIQGILTRLGFQIADTETGWNVTVPSYRATKDISIPEDLVEEVGRIFGFDNITPISPNSPIVPPFTEPMDRFQRELRNLASLEGECTEVYCYAFNGEEAVKKLGLEPAEHLRLANPLNSEQALMRRSLLPNLLEVARENFKNFQGFKLYELGPVFLPREGKLPDERPMFCAVVAAQKSLQGECYYEAKGLFNLMSESLGLVDTCLNTEELESWMHPGRAAWIMQGNAKLGAIAELHPKVAAAVDIPGAVGILYLDAQALFDAKRLGISFKGVPQFPPVTFDVAVLVDLKTPVADVERVIRQAERQYLKSVELFDIYSGKNIPEGKKSLAFSLMFLADRTLEPKEIDRLQRRVVDALNRNNYTVRDTK